jgi:signal transduction protein with GAF and PtsI domain
MLITCITTIARNTQALKTLKTVGQGLISLKISAKGELRYIKSIQDVVALWKEGADGKIVLVDDAGTTTLSPILPKLAGVVCTSGALGSHLAIVTREFEIPALMGTSIDDPDALHRKTVRIEPDEGSTGKLLVIS